MATTELAQEVEAGRELDAWVAERLMGWQRFPIRFNSQQTVLARDVEEAATYRLGWDVNQLAPHYSTDHAAALEVVDKLQASGLYVAINTTCDAGLYDVSVMDGVHFLSLGCAVFKPLALGVCLAAREAVERLSLRRAASEAVESQEAGA